MKANYVTFALTAIISLLSSRAPADVSRPDQEAGPTEVRIAVFIVDLDDVDTADQNFTANVALRASWQDKRLVNDQAGGKVVYPLTDIWNPRFQWVNQQKVWETFPRAAEVSAEGEVSYFQRVWGQFSQPLRLHDFPFDEQEFNIVLATVGHTPDDVTLLQDPEAPSGIAEQLSVADWKVTSSKTVAGVYSPIPAANSLAAFTLRVEAKRDSGYFALTVIIPLVLIVAMSWVVFWIDPKEGGTQIAVAMTSMLTLIAYRFAVASSLPNISYLTRLDIVLLGATLLVFSSLVEVMITSYLARSERLQLARRIDVVMRTVFPLALVGVFAIALLRT